MNVLERERGLHDAHMSLDVFGAPAEPAFWSAVRITTPREEIFYVEGAL